MKYVWEDLPKPLHCFTVKNTAMVNLNTGKIVQHYSSNVKIVVVQKCVTDKCTYYRTSDAAYHYLNYAFEASAFGLPNETAPPAHSANPKPAHNPNLKKPLAKNTTKPVEKNKKSSKKESSKGGEKTHCISWVKKFFRRKNG